MTLRSSKTMLKPIAMNNDHMVRITRIRVAVYLIASPSSPATPTIRGRISPLDCVTPPTTISRYAAVSTIPKRTLTEMFSNPLQTNKDYRFANVGNPPEIALERSYQLDGKDHLLIQQLTEVDCGITSFLMVYTDLIDSASNFALSDDHWKKHLSSGSFPSALSQLIPNAPLEKLGVQCQLNTISNDSNILNVCKNHIERTRHSIIANISFPETNGGHFIVIDKIDDRDVYLRDPYTGKAYRVPRDKFLDKTADHEVKVENFLFFTFEAHRVARI